MSGERIYTFTRQATYIQVGCVTATSKEEAKRKIADGDYDDIFDTMLEEEHNETIEVDD